MSRTFLLEWNSASMAQPMMSSLVSKIELSKIFNFGKKQKLHGVKLGE